MTVEFNRIRNKNDLIRFKELWKVADLGPDMTVFQSYEWNILLFKEWDKETANKFFSKIYVVIGKDEESGSYLIFPLLVQQRKQIMERKKGIFLLGYGSYSDYLSPIYERFDKNLFEECVKEIVTRFQLPFYLMNLLEKNSLCKYLSGRTQSIIGTEVSVAVRIPNNENEYDAVISKHTKQNLRTALNRMKKDEVDYRWNECGIMDNELAQECVKLHILRMRSKYDYPNDTILNRLKNSYSIHKKIRKEKKNNIVYNSMLSLENSFALVVYVKGELAGYIYGLKDNNRAVRIMQNCVNEKYKFYSPMFRCMYDYILECCKSGKYTELDFLRGNEEYKYKLGGEETKLFDFVV